MIMSKSPLLKTFIIMYTKKVKPKLITDSCALHISAKEVQIPTDFGYIAGKWWGSEKQRPMLALHGWQDNAGSWDRLVPLLRPGCSVLAIDFAGHGNSSWYPKGMQYFNWDLIRTIQYVVDYYKWDKVSLLSHSMGSIASFRYTSLFPNNVDMYIAFENLIPERFDFNQLFKRFPGELRKLQIAQTRLEEEPPSYPYEEALKIWHNGTGKSVSLETAHCLVDRGTKQSKNDPNNYYFSRDSRLKYGLFISEEKQFVRLSATRIKCPLLYFKVTDSKYATDPFSVEIRELLQKTHETFECHFVPGTHHVHLNNPEIVAPIINQFLDKYNLFQYETNAPDVHNVSCQISSKY